MKKGLLIALMSIATLGSSTKAEAFFYYYPANGISIDLGGVGLFFPLSQRSTYIYPRYIETDPKVALLGMGFIGASFATAMSLVGFSEIFSGLLDCAKGSISHENDGAEIPRGLAEVTVASVVGALSIIAVNESLK